VIWCTDGRVNAGSLSSEWQHWIHCEAGLGPWLCKINHRHTGHDVLLHMYQRSSRHCKQGDDGLSSSLAAGRSGGWYSQSGRGRFWKRHLMDYLAIIRAESWGHT
jgi:hypothetical protein